MSYVGIDIGGTNVRYTYIDKIDSKPIIYKNRSFMRTGNPYKEVEENICTVINMAPGNLEGIGISLAAVMDRSSGKVKVWPNNQCWNHFDLVHYLKKKYNVPIVIEDDANCGAIGEYIYLSTKVKNMSYITIGTGIGCGLILNESLFIGENGFAGELGHICLDYKNQNDICSCGNKGCFQSMSSGPAVLNAYNMTANEKMKSFEQISKEYMKNNVIAVSCMTNMIDNISMVIYNLAMCLDILVFVIGGGVSNLGTLFISKIEQKVNRRMNSFERNVLIKQAQLGEYSGVYGALQLLNK